MSLWPKPAFYLLFCFIIKTRDFLLIFFCFVCFVMEIIHYIIILSSEMAFNVNTLTLHLQDLTQLSRFFFATRYSEQTKISDFMKLQYHTSSEYLSN